MGFSGMLVFCRSERPLAEAPVIRALPRKYQEELAAYGEWPIRPGRWRTAQISCDYWEDEALRDLVAWTDAPVCVAYVYASEVATVAGLTPRGDWWGATLNIRAAADLWADVPDPADGAAGAPHLHRHHRMVVQHSNPRSP